MAQIPETNRETVSKAKKLRFFIGHLSVEQAFARPTLH
jgi:hypothetical protein